MRAVMRLLTAIRFVLFVFVLAPTSLLALDPAKRPTQYTHDVWQSRGDLPLDSIQAVIQSSDGYLWIGTPNGLLRFDGITLTPFDTRETPGFPNNNVQAPDREWYEHVTGLEPADLYEAQRARGYSAGATR